MKWFVMKYKYETPTQIIWGKASKYFPTRKKAQTEMKKLKRKHPKTRFKIGGEGKKY